MLRVESCVEHTMIHNHTSWMDRHATSTTTQKMEYNICIYYRKVHHDAGMLYFSHVPVSRCASSTSRLSWRNVDGSSMRFVRFWLESSAFFNDIRKGFRSLISTASALLSALAGRATTVPDDNICTPVVSLRKADVIRILIRTIFFWTSKMVHMRVTFFGRKRKTVLFGDMVSDRGIYIYKYIYILKTCPI